jgi:hypothetical protein
VNPSVSPKWQDLGKVRVSAHRGVGFVHVFLADRCYDGVPPVPTPMTTTKVSGADGSSHTMRRLLLRVVCR